jgi:hypothetical protein
MVLDDYSNKIFSFRGSFLTICITDWVLAIIGLEMANKEPCRQFIKWENSFRTDFYDTLIL